MLVLKHTKNKYYKIGGQSFYIFNNLIYFDVDDEVKITRHEVTNTPFETIKDNRFKKTITKHDYKINDIVKGYYGNN